MKIDAKCSEIYSHPFLTHLTSTFSSNTVEAFLDENEEFGKILIDFIIDRLAPEVQSIVSFIQGHSIKEVKSK
jgi:hypothetical protein